MPGMFWPPVGLYVFRVVINLLRSCRAIITSCQQLLPFGMPPKWLHKVIFSGDCIQFHRDGAIFRDCSYPLNNLCVIML